MRLPGGFSKSKHHRATRRRGAFGIKNRTFGTPRGIHHASPIGEAPRHHLASQAQQRLRGLAHPNALTGRLCVRHRRFAVQHQLTLLVVGHLTNHLNAQLLKKLPTLPISSGIACTGHPRCQHRATPRTKAMDTAAVGITQRYRRRQNQNTARGLIRQAPQIIHLAKTTLALCEIGSPWIQHDVVISTDPRHVISCRFRSKQINSALRITEGDRGATSKHRYPPPEQGHHQHIDQRRNRNSEYEIRR